MQCAACGHANPSDAAFCSACGTALQRSCPSCSAPTAPGAAFCSNCGASLEDAPSGTPPQDLTRYLPSELLDKLRDARSGRAMAGERRTVTMLFADVQGSTAAAEQLDPEEWADIINGAFERLIRPVYRYEGTLARLMGDAVLAFFGAPIAHEDDPERAVLAGLAMLDEAEPYAAEVRRRWGVDFAVRIGINTGLVVVGEVGSDLRVEYTALGDAVNVAARMEQTAEPGTLQITGETHRLVDGLFDFDDAVPVTVKGKTQPVLAYRVKAVKERRGDARRSRGNQSRLVGRDADLEALRSVVEDVRSGIGRVCSVVGEAGVGKSRLLASLRDDLQAIECIAPWTAADDLPPDRTKWAEARCLSYDTSVPHAPFIDLFTRMFDLDGLEEEARRDRVAAAADAVGAGEIAPYLCVMLGIDPGGGEAMVIAELPAPTLQRRVFSAVVTFLTACTSTSPGILVFEDLHWADSVSLALLEEILKATDRSMIGLIAVMRPYRQDPSWRFHESAQRSLSHRYTLIELDPLGEDACRLMLEDLLGDDSLSEELEGTILARADGNPFYVEETVRSLIESGGLRADDGTWSLEDAAIAIPDTIAGLLTARLDRLGGDSKLAAQLASVLGRDFAFGELAELVGEATTAEDAVADLMRRDLVVELRRIPTREYSFRHALIQEAAYSTILLKDRQALHSRVAEQLITTDSDDPQEIARHLLESRQESRAVPYLVEAGDRAQRSMAISDAIRFYDQALEWAEADSDADSVSRAYDGLGSAYSLIPDLTKASASYQQLLEFGRRCAAPSIQITALNRLGFTSAFLGGDFVAASSYLDEARRLAEEAGDHSGLAEYHMNSCMIATSQGDVEGAAAHDAETARLGSSIGADGVHLGGLVQRALSLMHAMRFEEGRRALEKARLEAKGTNDPTVTAGLDAAEFFLRLREGDLVEAWQRIRTATELATRAGSSKASVLAWQAGLSAALVGDYESALAFHGDSVRLGRETLQFFNSAAAAASMVRIYAELGITGDEPSELREKALAYLEMPMGATTASTLHSELGWAALETNDLASAADSFGMGLAGSSATKLFEIPSLQIGLATVRVLSGDTAGATTLVDQAASFIEEKQLAYERPALNWVRGSIALAEGRHESAAESLTLAATEAQAMGLARIEWRVRADLAVALEGLGDSEGAASQREASHSAVEALAAMIVDSTVRESFLRKAARPADLPGSAA